MFEQPDDRIFKRFFLSPAVIILLVFSIFPLLWTVGVSVTTCQRSVIQSEQNAFNIGNVLCLGNQAELSLNNFARIFTDTRLQTAARNTLFYVVFGVTLQYVIGFGLALLLNQDFFGRGFFRLVFLLPMMLTPVAVGYVGRMMFDSSISPLSQLIRSVATFLNSTFGLQLATTVPWLTDKYITPFTMVLMDSWQWIPFMILLLLAGMQGIPDEIYEAARVDGAGPVRIFFSITFPIMLPISLTAILIRSLEMFKIIDVINVTTGGGPGGSTESLVMYVFDTALNFGNYGYAAAIGLVLLVLVVLTATVFLLGFRRIIQRQLGS
jgi:multiple sugar transport system permease protein